MNIEKYSSVCTIPVVVGAAIVVVMPTVSFAIVEIHLDCFVVCLLRPELESHYHALTNNAV